MIELIFLLAAVWMGALIWKDRIRERKFQEGLDKVKTFLDENPGFLEDEPDLVWYDLSDATTCEICDDVVYEDEAIVIVPFEDGGQVVFCEYCLNPDVKA